MREQEEADYRYLTPEALAEPDVRERDQICTVAPPRTRGEEQLNLIIFLASSHSHRPRK